MLRRFPLILLMLPMVFMTGCDLFDDTNPGAEFDVEFWLTGPAGSSTTEFNHGDDIMFHWRFTNTSGTEIVWNQPGTFPYVNFYLYVDDPAGEVFIGKTWPAGDYPPSREMKLPAGDALYFEIKWSADSAHEPLPIGQYKVVAISMINLPYLGEPRNLVETFVVE